MASGASEKRLTGESAGKLATFLESLDDEGLGAYVNFLNMREDLKFECKEYAEIFNDLAADFGDKNDLE